MSSITIDPAGAGREFEGFGAVSAGASSRLLVDYPEPQRGEILDLLFAPEGGACLQHLKVEIGSDTNSTDGAEPSHARSAGDRDYHRGYEWWLMSEAKRRNPAIVLEALCWGAPGWLGGGRYFSQDTAEYIVDFIEGARDHHGLDIAYVGVWNEMNYEKEWIKLLKRLLGSHGLDTKVVVADGFWQPVVGDLKADSEFLATADVVGAHYPTYGSPDEAVAWGKSLWSSEDGPWNKVDDGMSGEWPGARELARIYNRNYIDGRMTKTLVWSPVTAYYDNLMIPGSGLMEAKEPWSGHYRAQHSLWVTAHTTQFAKPGWRYLDDASGLLEYGGSHVALASPDGRDVTVVLETIGAKRVQHVEIRGVNRPLRAWITTADRHLEAMDLATALELPPEVVVTVSTVEPAARGSSRAPASAPFPFPYRAEFTAVDGERSLRWLCDQEGAFELAHGGLEQVIDTPPIPWTGTILTPDAPHPTPAQNPGRPLAIVGDPGWRDYTVCTLAELTSRGEVFLAGRVTGPPPKTWTLPGRYELAVADEGGWELRVVVPWEETRVLATGQASGNGKRRLALGFRGDRITAAIDGDTVAELHDATFPAGSVGIGTGWHRARFSLLEVEPG